MNRGLLGSEFGPAGTVMVELFVSALQALNLVCRIFLGRLSQSLCVCAGGRVCGNQGSKLPGRYQPRSSWERETDDPSGFEISQNFGQTWT